MGSPRPSPSSVCPDVLALAIAAALLGASGVAGASANAGASTGVGVHVSLDEPVTRPAADDEQRLFLEIYHGDRPIGLIAELLLRGDRFWAMPAELAEIGFAVPAGALAAADDDGRVPLDALPGLSWRYDAAAQRLHLEIPAALRPQQALGYSAPQAVQAERPPGLQFNYDAFAQHRDELSSLAVGTQLGWFGRLGTFEIDGVSRFGDTEDLDRWTRLDTRWLYSDPGHMWTWTVGDLVSGGVAWSRPVRLGGVQWRRNFATRPDLVTMPLPRFSADATLPSAVELYVDNVRRFGSEVQDGPFVLDAVPSISGAGTAQLVVRDALGRVTTTSVPLYFDNERLAPGLTDFSVELGALRRGYGTRDDEYADEMAGSASWRRGMTDTFTAEAHAEATDGLTLFGAGAVWAPGNRWGLVTASVARSTGDHDGWQHSVGYQYHSRRWGLDLLSQRRSDGWRDLGDLSVFPGEPPSSSRSDDRATVWVPTRAGDFAASWLRSEDRDGVRTTVRSLSWNRQFGNAAFVSASLFDDGERTGGGVNISIPLGQQRQVALSVQHDDGDTDAVATFRQSPPYEGGWGWGAQAGTRDGGQGGAYAEYRGDFIEARAGVDYDGRSTGTYASATGSIVRLGGETYFSRRIYDAFALVSTGTGGVPVLYENRLYGTTDADGHLLVTELRGWQRNRIAIDPDRLPANYRVGDIERFATPTDRGGAIVEFDVRRLAPAIVVLSGPDGAPLAAGSRVRSDGGPDLVVGFDGEVYLESLDRSTVLTAGVDGAICRYALPAVTADAGGAPARLGPQACH